LVLVLTFQRALLGTAVKLNSSVTVTAKKSQLPGSSGLAFDNTAKETEEKTSEEVGRPMIKSYQVKFPG